MLHYLLSSRYPFMYSIKKPFVPEKRIRRSPTSRSLSIIILLYWCRVFICLEVIKLTTNHLVKKKIHSFAQKNRSSRKKREVFIIYIFVSYSVLMLKERGLSSEKYRKEKKKKTKTKTKVTNE